MGGPLLALAAVAALLAPPGPLAAATTQYVVVDRYTGLAILGFDPVAYFEGTALEGKGEHELALAGAVWRFRNAGNLAAFAMDPDVYIPRFGGYDPVGVAEGIALPCDPRLWLVSGQRLYLFHSAEARAAFAANEDAIIADAERNWPSVQRTLSP